MRPVVLVSVVAAIGAAGAIVAVTSAGHGSHPAAARGPTTTVERRDLVATEDVNGTLSFADDRQFVGPAAGAITDLPDAGAVLEPGSVLCVLADTPLVLLQGKRPLARTLSEGVPDGVDVRALEANLVSLGLDPHHLIRVDEHFAASTRAAVESFQRRYHQPVTGAVDQTEVFFAPGPTRVTGVLVAPGTTVASGEPILELASSQLVARLTISTDERTLARLGARVQIVLPDGATVPGTITSVGGSTTPAADAQGGASADSTITATASITGPRLDYPDGTPITVQLTVNVRRNVLAVPVTALVSTSGNARALEVVGANGRTTLLPVTTGLFAGGYVEIRGPHVAAGLRVVVAAV